MADGMDEADNGGEAVAPALFALRPHDRAAINEILRGLRDLVARPSLPPSRLRYLSFALLALQRLPLTTPGVELDITLSHRFENEMTYHGVYIGSDSLRLEAGGSVYTPGVGSDNYSDAVFEVEPYGFRHSNGPDALSHWLEEFRTRCRDSSCDLTFDWLGDETEIEWDEDLDEDYWARLATDEEEAGE